MNWFLTRKPGTAFLLFLAILLLTPVRGMAGNDIPVSHTIKLLAESSTGGPQPVIAVLLNIAEGYHIYANEERQNGKPLEVIPEASPGIETTVYYPPSTTIADSTDASVRIKAHFHTTPVFIRIRCLGEAPMPSSIDVRIRGLACSNQNCIPFSLNFPVFLPPAASLPLLSGSATLHHAFRTARADDNARNLSAPVPMRPSSHDAWNFHPRYADVSAEPTGLLDALLFGLIAGLVLNVMPCVLPVLALKIASLNAILGHSSRDFRLHNLAYSAGIMVWFAFFALIFTAAGSLWGSVFRSPWALSILAGILILLSLSLFGIFTLPMPGLRIGADRGTLKDSFISGLLVTILATPCSGPLLGGVLGWAVMHSPFELGIVFLAVGLGMSLPFLAMVLFPHCSRLLPKPGAWCSTVAKAAGILLLVTAGYLITLLPWSSDQPTVFSETDFRSRLGQDNLLVQFTADWCPTCKVLERTVLTRSTLAPLQAKYGLKYIRIDLTRESPSAEGILRSLGSVSIPLTAIFPKGQRSSEPVVLRDIYATATLQKTIDNALGQTNHRFSTNQ